MANLDPTPERLAELRAKLRTLPDCDALCDAAARGLEAEADIDPTELANAIMQTLRERRPRVSIHAACIAQHDRLVAALREARGVLLAIKIMTPGDVYEAADAAERDIDALLREFDAPRKDDDGE